MIDNKIRDKSNKEALITMGIIVLVVLTLAAVPLLKDYETQSSIAEIKGKLLDQPDALIYLPSTLVQGKIYPMVVTFSPNGEASLLIQFWQPLAEQRQLIIYSSKIYRNRDDPVTKEFHQGELAQIKNYIDQAIQGLPVDRRKIIFAGPSGGGSWSHSMNVAYPGFAYGLIVNTGKFWELDDQPQLTMQQFGVARNKIAFLASPTDFRYQEMQRDYSWMKQWGFPVNWIEFEGGHRHAPRENYAQALNWLFAKKPSVSEVVQNPKLQKQSSPSQPADNMRPYSYK